MTSIVGINCADGVVIGTDSAVSFEHGSYRTIEQQSDKITIIEDCIVIAGTGSVGLGQRFEYLAQKLWTEPNIQKQISDGVAVPLGLVRLIANNTIENFKSTHLQPGKFNYGALVAFPLNGESHLCEFSFGSFQPEFKTERLWYCSMGSAQPITDPFLAFMRAIFWKGLPTVHEATFATTWTLDHAIQVNPGGVKGPIQIGVLENDSFRARILDDDELGEHRECIQDAKVALKEFRESYRVDDDEDIPDIPKPG